MRFAHLGIPAAAVLLLLTGSTSLFQAPPSGLIFSGVRACPEHKHLVYAVHDGHGGAPDTLCSDVVTGERLWGGGPVRGLWARGDTVHAATLVGTVSITPGARWFTPFPVPNPRPRAEDPGWREATALGAEQPFPERYHGQPDSSVVFLVDAEHAPGFDRRWHDLHLRTAEGTEWLAARNLAVLDWVLSPDRSHWALAALAWMPDYGGQTKHVLLAGSGRRVERFELGPLARVIWDDGPTLWTLREDGQLIRIEPQEQAWRVTPVDLAQHHCGTAPAGGDSVWSWVGPESFAEYTAARAEAATSDQGWVARGEQGFRACWWGYVSAEDLKRFRPEAPVADAEARLMPLEDSDFLGTARHFRSPGLYGEASVMHVLKKNQRSSELWWRYHGQNRVRLAGPWTTPTQREGAR